jgi:hypothetical protein
MEYTFKNSPSKKPTTIILNDYAMVLQKIGEERVIPYSNIQSVSLRKKGKKFFTVLKCIDGTEEHISNWFYLSHTQGEDRSAQYTPFVRILHTYLRKKSAAYYVCGSSLSTILFLACAAVIVSFLFSFAIDAFDLSPINTNVLSLLLSVVSLSIVTISNWDNFPNVYKPENIPVKYLP